MEEFVCLTLRSRPGEPMSQFAERLSGFWTMMLRQHKEDFEQVYAETTSFEEDDDCWTRMYLAHDGVIDLLLERLAQAGIEHDPVDRDDTYSRYEASGPDWMQIEH